MSPTKRVKSTPEEDEAFAKETPTRFPWLFSELFPPENVTYRGLLQRSEFMWKFDKIFVDEHTDSLYQSHRASMSPEEFARFNTSHKLSQEFED